MKNRLLDIYQQESKKAYFKGLEINKYEVYDSNKGFIFFLLYTKWKYGYDGPRLFEKSNCKLLREEGKFNIYVYIKEYGFFLGK